jgi:hypothetical protein
MMSPLISVGFCISPRVFWSESNFVCLLFCTAGKSQPVDYPGNRGGWESGNDTARVVICVFGTLILMVADVIVNDPSNFPARFSKSYREAITAVGFTIGFVALASLACAYLDLVAVSEHTGCTSCDRSSYWATCLFDVFSAIALVCR